MSLAATPILTLRFYMTGRANGVKLPYCNTDFFGLVDGLNFALQYRVKMKAKALTM